MKDNLFDSPDTQLSKFSTMAPPTGLSQAEEVGAISLILSSLRKYWYVVVLTSTAVMAVTTYKTLNEPRIYRSSMQILVDLKQDLSDAEKLVSSGNGNNAVAPNTAITVETITQLLKSRNMVQKAIETIPNGELRPSADEVIENLVIQQQPNTDILEIGYTDTKAPRTFAVLNALGKTYIDYSIKNKKARTDNSINFIESQVPESRKRLEESSKLIEKFRSDYRFSDPATAAASLNAYRQEITSKLNDSRVTYLQTQREYQQLKQQLTAVGLSSNSLSTTMLTQDGAYQKLFEEFSKLDLNYSQEKVRLSEDNPIVVSLREKRDQVLLLMRERAQQVLKRDVSNAELTNGSIANFSNSLAQTLAYKQAQIETALAAQTAQYKALLDVYQQLEKRISQLPLLQGQYTELERQYKIQSQELTTFMQKLQELKIVNAEQVVPWSILSQPIVPEVPLTPNIPRQLALGGVASLLVGMLAAFGLKKLDSSIEDAETVKSLTGMPILALIPKVEDFQQSLARGSARIPTATSKRKNYSYWSFIDAIQSLALGIGFRMDREENQLGKVIVITSASAKEGKSTIAFNTSIILSQLGYRVLLIDGDLYQSRVTELCTNSPLFSSVDCSSKAGLTDAIAGVNKWQDLIKRAPQSKLDVLFSGSPAVNSIALLNSPRLIQLMAQWRQKYDYVIFDTPPIVGVSDTRLIAARVDGLIYVVGLNVAQRKQINRAMDILSSIRTPVLGAVINQVENQHNGDKNQFRYYQKISSLQEGTPLLTSEGLESSAPRSKN